MNILRAHPSTARRFVSVLGLAILLLTWAACSGPPRPFRRCELHGGTWESRMPEDGDSAGIVNVCVFADGGECTMAEMFAFACAPAGDMATHITPRSPLPTPVVIRTGDVYLVDDYELADVVTAVQAYDLELFYIARTIPTTDPPMKEMINARSQPWQTVAELRSHLWHTSASTLINRQQAEALVSVDGCWESHRCPDIYTNHFTVEGTLATLEAFAQGAEMVAGIGVANPPGAPTVLGDPSQWVEEAAR